MILSLNLRERLWLGPWLWHATHVARRRRGHGAGSPALFAGRRYRCGLALPHVREGWHGSCSMVRIETCARHPGWSSLRRQDDSSSNMGVRVG